MAALEQMGRLRRQTNLRDQPDSLGLTEDEAIALANERGLRLRLVVEDDDRPMQANISARRVTAELEGGLIVYAQRY